MYEKVFEQTERFFKPVGEIWALQAQAAETLARKQTSILTDVWNQGVTTLQSIPAQKNFEDVWKLQQEYWENVSGSMREMIEDSQGILLDTNQKITEVLQKAAPEAGAVVKGAAETIAEKATAVAKKAQAPAKKAAAPAAATAPVPAPASAPAKAAAKVAAPPVPVKPIADAVKSASSGKDAGTDKKAAPVAAKAESGKPEQTAKSGSASDGKTGKLL
jgi:Predicted membrane protein